MLAVTLCAETSYVTKKRGNFEADGLLAVARNANTSYAAKPRERHGDFEADGLLAVA